MVLKDIPNILTLMRIMLIPVMVGSFYVEDKTVHYFAAGIFIFASITDYFDGFLARKLHAQTSLGKVLDPIADKLLVASTLMMLVHFDRAPVLPTIAILCREILVSGLREYLSDIAINLPVSNFGKIKTALQMLAIIILLLGEEGTGFKFADIFGDIMIWIAATLTLVSGYAYCKEGFKHL
jgi:CDP-diacylglycerol--glycerol-3-phosphate 3-phosphatidyltransferase